MNDVGKKTADHAAAPIKRNRTTPDQPPPQPRSSGPDMVVVIPYYQREPGILRCAVESVAKQRDCGYPVRVLVVDDASPAPAEADLAGLRLPAHMSLRVLRQPNGGPGSARNCGLAAAAGARYVAFLDSDDTWAADHLARAVAALETGFDFFFADHLQLGAQCPAFERAGRLHAAQHPALAAGPDLHAYAGDMLAQIALGNVIGTSTVVYRYERFAGLRFQVEFRSAGEDYLFWIALVDAGARLCFSAQVQARYGRGVNVYAGAAWGTGAHLRRVHDESRYKLRLLGHPQLHAHQRRSLRDQRRRLRQEFIGSLARLVVRRGRPPWALLVRHLACDPWWPVHVPALMVRRALRIG